MIQFYAPEISISNQLPEGESAHCSRVLRLKEGDEIVVTDGKGSRYICEITRSHPKNTEFVIKETKSIPLQRSYRLTLAIAPTKNSDRIEWMLEKAVEIGVDKIVLLRCERSERKTMRPDRLLKVMVSAMKQSLGVYVPELEELKSFKEFVEADYGKAQKYFGYCSEAYPRLEFVKECKPGGEVIVMIGPEGDFTPSEVEMGVANGFMPVTFGDKRLRTETAALFAVCGVDIINQL